MNFETALMLFEHTVKKTERVSAAVNGGMLDLVDQGLIELTSLEVSNALATGERIWMSSDWHFLHHNIIKYCGRPHFDVGSMNEALLQLLGKVDPSELLVIVGDVAIGNFEASVELVRRIPGRKILVVGNHDLTQDGKCRWLGESGLFEAIVPFLFWSGPRGRDVLACHYPASVPDRYKQHSPLLNYHGHLHQHVLAPTEKVKYMNMGWDVDYALRVL
jgi:calcineurin-like phosphoesterase family protein